MTNKTQQGGVDEHQQNTIRRHKRPTKHQKMVSTSTNTTQGKAQMTNKTQQRTLTNINRAQGGEDDQQHITRGH
jgi:hypothetical protein